VGALKKSELPGPEALQKPGQVEGQHIIINNSGRVEAHTWSVEQGQWQCLGA
jgi:phospholipase A-2-activating protein